MIDPKNLRYTPSHEWVLLEGDVATVGVSRFAVDQLTDLIMIDLSKATVGSRVTAGESFGEVESVKAVADLYSPVDGEIVEVNGNVVHDVQILSQDPYTEGWLLKVKVDDPSKIQNEMLDAAAYEAKLNESQHD